MNRLRDIVVLTTLVLTPSLVSAQTKTVKPAPKATQSVPAPKATQSVANAALKKAQQALDDGRFSVALREGIAFASKYPNRYEGQRLIAQACLELDQPDRASTAFRQALKLAPAAAKPGLQKGLQEAVSLKLALKNVEQARAFKAGGQLAAAAKAEERAYRAVPSRYAYGLTAAELYESAGQRETALDLLAEIRKQSLPAAIASQVEQRQDAIQAKIDDERQKLADEEDRKRAEADRVAEAKRQAEERKAAQARAEERRKQEEADRQAELDRQKAEKARLDQEERDRLNRYLDDQKRAVSDAESSVRQLESTVSDTEHRFHRLDSEAADARGDRDRAKRERDDWQDKVDNSKTDVAKEFNRGQLRSAQSAYDDAKDKFASIDRRRDAEEAKLNQAKQDLDAARSKLSQCRSDVRATEDALNRLNSGS